MANVELHVDAMDMKKLAEKINSLDAAGKKVWKKVAGKVIPGAVARVKAATPEKTGLLKRSISGKVNIYGNVRIFVDSKVFAVKRNGQWNRVVLKGAAKRTSWKDRRAQLGKLKRPAKYATPVQYGRKKGGKPAPARPFIGAAFDGQEERIITQVVTEFDAEMSRIAAK